VVIDPSDSWLTDFFVAGGTLRPDSPSYVCRPADEELFNRVLAGEFCYVLSARQLGKSSLMIRTTIRLKQEGVAASIIDLTKIGTNVTVEQWYLGLMTKLERQLHLSTNPETWWNERSSLSPVQRFTDFLHDVILTEIRGPVVIFIDEIDTTLKLPFSDDFFAAVRSVYNERARDGIFQRLTFVLLGVATPAELIKNRNLTPFNIGQAINLYDFSRADARILQSGLQVAYPDYGEIIFARIFHWTNGHPYLTQKLCLYAAELGLKQLGLRQWTEYFGESSDFQSPFSGMTPEAEDIPWTEERVDELVERLFLSEESSRETNLQFVRDTIRANPQRGRLLKLYQQIYENKVIPEDERSTEQNQLKLIGLVRVEKGVLKVRNEIYRRVFNKAWINNNRPPLDWSRPAAYAWMVLTIILTIGISIYVYRDQNRQTISEEAQALTYSFRSSTDSTVRIKRLAGLYNLPGYTEQANKLFRELSPTQQVELFNLSDPSAVGNQLVDVVKGLYTAPDISEQEALLQAMDKSLQGLDNTVAINIATEIEEWLKGRNLYRRHQYTESVTVYNTAIEINHRNPGTHFGRALTYFALADLDKALLDLDTTVSLSQPWRDPVRLTIQANQPLYLAWWQHPPQDYRNLAALLPTPTSTSTPTSSPTHTAVPTATSPPVYTPTPSATVMLKPTATFTPQPPTHTPTMSKAEVSLAQAMIPTRLPDTLVYVKSNGKTHDLGLVNGTGQVLDEKLHALAAAPAWSPNGNKIAFFGEEGISQLGGAYRAGSGIWLITLSNRQVNQLLPQGYILNMSWSPDGTKLAFETQSPPKGVKEINVIDAGTGQKISRFMGEQPAWRNDSQKLAVKTCMPECGLWLFDIDGNNGERLTFDSTDSYAAWSPTGEYLAFTSRARAGNWEIYLLRWADAKITRLTHRAASDVTPVFSPTGHQLYIRTDAFGSWGITALSLDGKNEQLIIANIGYSDDWGAARPTVH